MWQFILLSFCVHACHLVQVISSCPGVDSAVDFILFFLQVFLSEKSSKGEIQRSCPDYLNQSFNPFETSLVSFSTSYVDPVNGQVSAGRNGFGFKWAVLIWVENGVGCKLVDINGHGWIWVTRIFKFHRKSKFMNILTSYILP